MNALISEHSAARKLAISVRKLREMVRADQIPVVEFPDGEIRFDAGDLAEWVENHRRAGDASQPVLSGTA